MFPAYVVEGISVVVPEILLLQYGRGAVQESPVNEAVAERKSQSSLQLGIITTSSVTSDNQNLGEPSASSRKYQ